MIDDRPLQLLSSLADGVVDVYRVRVNRESPLVGPPLRDIKLGPDWMIAALRRTGQAAIISESSLTHAHGLLGPTGGYLMSYPIAAFLTGYLAERGMDRRYLTSVLAMLGGLVVVGLDLGSIAKRWFAGDYGFFLHNVSSADFPAMAFSDATVGSKWFFQFAFAAVPLAIVWGTTLERIKFGAYLIYAVIFAAVIYPLASHWIFGGGWLQANFGMQDFAGSTVIHLVGATGAGDVKLFAASGALLGPRATLWAFAFTMLAGGMIAIVFAG